MTSEAPHRPGQEPGEVSPGAGGPAPYGDRPAHQDNGYPGAPDLGWAPPPPAGRPNPPAPAWGQDEQSGAPAWGQQGDQPATAAWGAAQVPSQGERGGWNPPPGAPQPTWTPPQEQGGPAWAAASPQGDQSPPAWATQHEQPGPAWGGGPAEQPGPAWATPAGGPGEQPQPGWAQAGEAGTRGAAQVPAQTPQQQDDPARGWNAAPQQDDSARAGGWQPTPAAQDDHSGGWPVGAAAQPQDGPAQQGAWPDAGDQRDDQPAWAQQGAQAGWAQAGEPAARGAAQVPAPAVQPHEAWATPAVQQDDPARSGGWPAGTPGRQDEGERAWNPGASHEQDESVRSGGWEAGAATPRDDDPDRSGGWAAGRAAARVEQQPSWGTPENSPPVQGWNDAPQQQERPTPDWANADEPAQSGGWAAASVPARDERPDAEDRTPPASASVPAGDGPPAWGTAPNAETPQWNRSERPAVPEGEPWSPQEVWGRAAEAEPTPAQSTGWDQDRAEDPPAYQPSLGPGISPGNAVPLPRQEQRVPGASLAAAPPADYAPPAQFGPPEHGGAPQAYEPPQAGGWGGAEPAHEEPQSPAGPVVPAPRTSPESGAGGRASVPPAEPGGPGSVSASASVPLASRVMPPTDQALRPGGTPAPQPRVYGRPSRPEPEEAPEQDGPDGYPEQGGQPRFDEPDRPQNAFAEAPPVPSAPPSSPAGPPPFPPGVPSFVNPAGSNRPVNGVHPHNDERPADPFGGPGAPGGPGDPFAGQGGPQDSFAGQGGPRDPFGGPGGPGDPFAGPGGGRASVNGTPGHGPGQGGFPGGFPPPSQTAPPAWQQPGAGSGESEQGRFDSFKPDAEPKTEAPAPKVRNGRVLALVLIAAVLILAVPLGLLTLLGKVGGDDKPAAFDPAVGSCVKQSGQSAVPVECGEQGAFTVVSKVDTKEKCADPTQPQVVLQGDVPNKVLCLQPATAK